MTASERAAELRALADQHDALGELEDALTDALDAYRADPDDDTKQAYTEASEALRAARAEVRGSGLMVASNEPGSTAIGAPVIGKVG